MSGIRESQILKTAVAGSTVGKGLKRTDLEIRSVNSFPTRASLLTSKIVWHILKRVVAGGTVGEGLSALSNTRFMIILVRGEVLVVKGLTDLSANLSSEPFLYSTGQN